MRKMFQIRKHDDRWREKERGDLEDEKKDVGDGDDLEKELFLRENLPFLCLFSSFFLSSFWRVCKPESPMSDSRKEASYFRRYSFFFLLRRISPFC